MAEPNPTGTLSLANRDHALGEMIRAISAAQLPVPAMPKLRRAKGAGGSEPAGGVARTAVSSGGVAIRALNAGAAELWRRATRLTKHRRLIIFVQNRASTKRACTRA